MSGYLIIRTAQKIGSMKNISVKLSIENIYVIIYTDKELDKDDYLRIKMFWDITEIIVFVQKRFIILTRLYPIWG